jgi:hypothetical protein
LRYDVAPIDRGDAFADALPIVNGILNTLTEGITIPLFILVATTCVADDGAVIIIVGATVVVAAAWRRPPNP